MKRRDWPEIADRSWCPAWLRSAMMAYLQKVEDVTEPYAHAATAIGPLLERSSSARIIDLCSGGGGPWPRLHRRLQEVTGVTAEVTLTDLDPDASAVERFAGVRGIAYRPEPVSAERVPGELRGVRTMFTGLHHFSPAEVANILADAQRSRAHFAAFEATHRSVKGVMITLLIPLMVLLLMPRVRPRRMVPLVLTYLPPILPMAIWWDGLVSTLRTYRAEEIREIVRGIEVPDYEWHIREEGVQGSPLPLLQVVGYPRQVHGADRPPAARVSAPAPG